MAGAQETITGKLGLRQDLSGQGGSTPRVSVVLPVHNGERYVRESLDSVRQQTFRDYEVVVVNDGSTDRTEEILRSCAEVDPRVRVLTRKVCAGVSAARNMGIAEACGDWIAFLDADDLWDPEKIEVQLSAATPGDDVVHSDARAVDETGKVTMRSIHEGRDLPALGLVDLITWNRLLLLTVMVKRSALETVGGFDQTSRFAEDWQLWLRLAATGHHFRYVNRVLASYRIHPGNTSADRERLAHAEVCALRKTRRDYPDVFGKEETRAYHRRLFQLGYDAGWTRYDEGNYAQAARHFRRAVRHKPTSLRSWTYLLATHLPFRGKVLPCARNMLRVIHRKSGVSP